MIIGQWLNLGPIARFKPLYTSAALTRFVNKNHSHNVNQLSSVVVEIAVL